MAFGLVPTSPRSQSSSLVLSMSRSAVSMSAIVHTSRYRKQAGFSDAASDAILPAMTPKAVKRSVQFIARQSWFPAFGKRTVPYIDKVLYKATRGRVGTMSASGFTGLVLTTVGRKTGKERSVPVLRPTVVRRSEEHTSELQSH